MNSRQLQRSLDRLLATTGQRFALSGLLFVVAVVPSLVISRQTEASDAWLIVLVALQALVVVIEPDEHLAAVLLGVLAFQWLTIDVPLSSPWVLAFAATLFTVHVLTALLAATPHTATIGADVMGRWLRRSVPVAAVTLVVWLAARLTASWNLSGSILGTTIALLALTLTALGVRRLVLTP